MADFVDRTTRAAVEPFTPPALRINAEPPVFLLRKEVDRGRRFFARAIRRAGLRFHEPEMIRVEMLDALKGLWSPADYDRNLPRLAAFWALIDAGEEPEAGEREHVDELSFRLVKAAPRLAEMVADNADFARETQLIAISLACAGWRNIEVPFTLENGGVPLSRLEDVKDALEASAGVMGAIGFGQLATECLKKIHPITTTGDARETSKGNEND